MKVCSDCGNNLFKLHFSDINTLGMECNNCSDISELQLPEGSFSRYISKQKRYEVLARQRWNCNECGTKLKYGKEYSFVGEVAHIDHIHPYSKKESYPNFPENINELSNLQALCPDCNLKKGGKEIN